MPSEKPPVRRSAASAIPTWSKTWSILVSGIRLAAASTRRWFRAVTLGCTACASSSEPTFFVGYWMSAYRWPSNSV